MSDALKPVRKKSLADTVFDQLRQGILSGELEPGETLPAERALAEKLQVNRGAVREALKRLEQARLITIRHGGNTKVLNFRRTAGTDLLSALLVDEEGNLDLRVGRSVIEMRSALAPSIARLCARRGRQVVERLDEILATMESEQDDRKALQMASLDFWATLVEGSDNIAYRLAFNSLRESYAHFAELLTDALAEEFEAIDKYRDLRDAVAVGEEERSARLAAEIIDLGATALLQVIEGLESLTASDSEDEQ
jgi:GntR family transcriptional regulator, transcriptional repressor for pyruvate dehydrogenase complex